MIDNVTNHYKMKNPIIIALVLLATICSCNDKKPKESIQTSSITDKVEDDSLVNEIEQDGEDKGGLNAIRFANFQDEDWLDNEYIRCLRSYIDDYNNGKIKDEDLDPYKEKIRGQFVIGSSEPFLLGGLFIRFIFLDSPNDIFSVWVYSDVDEVKKTVTGYSVRGIRLEDKESGFTKEEILRLVKEHPENKLW